MRPSPKFEIEHLISSLNTVSLSPVASDGFKDEIIQAVRALEQLGKYLETLLPYLQDDNSRLVALLDRIREENPSMLSRFDMQMVDKPAEGPTGRWLTDVERSSTRNEALRATVVEVIEASRSLPSSRAVRSDVRSVLIDSLGGRPW